MTKTELLQKFIENNCSAEEAKLAMQYIQQDPSLLDELLQKEDWDNIDDAGMLYPEVEDAMRKQVLAKTTKKPLIVFRKITAVAASIASLVFLASLLLNKTTPVWDSEPKVAEQETPATKSFTNNDSEIKRITLDDRSVVTLYPGAAIYFPAEFVTNRSIQLKGKAIFDVAKDEDHPFTVYTGTIATTAIGTKFLVDNRRGLADLLIELYEGKVVVQPVDTSSAFKSVYLLPGQECFVDMNSNKLIVQYVVPVPAVTPKKVAGKSMADEGEDVAIDLNFDKTPLAEVFERIEEIHNKEIEFGEADVNGLFFTGYFSKDESAETIIRLITTMNGLAITEADGKLKIYRSTEIVVKGGESQVMRENLHQDDLIILKPARQHRGIIANTAPELLNNVAEMAIPQPEYIYEKEGVIYFKNASLQNVVGKIIRSGGYEIIFDSKLMQGKYFTGQVEAGRPMINILGVILRMNNLKLDKNGDKYKITEL